MFKYLDPIKSLGLDDKTTSQLITCAYNYYQRKEINKNACSKKEFAKLISCFVRFFGSINTSKQIDEDIFQSYLKNEGLKGKGESIQILNKYINEIKQIQSAKILFSSPDLGNTLNAIDIKSNNRGRNIRNLVNFDYKIDVVISSNYSNKLLIPEIYFIFSLDDGEIIKVKVDLRMFNEFRKDLGMHIKKILINEGVSQIK
jgi:hypothetical protein